MSWEDIIINIGLCSSCSRRKELLGVISLQLGGRIVSSGTLSMEA